MPADANCIFCKIVAGDIPCHKLYEDDRVLAFLDIGPLSQGHCLVIPKDHYELLDQMPLELTGACMQTVSKLSKAVMASVTADGWNVLENNGPVAGQVVPHVHFHIIPRNDGDGLGYRWPAGKLSPENAESLKKAIREKLG
jgi:histidine triad (HIT) family protein